MSYKALYRTYRPMTFDEVAGQKHIVKTLQNALKEKKIAHAYLFCGPRGTGKTSMARLFAKALNCEHEFGTQCNECENCLAINEGTHPDVIEIDAASNRGIDDIRDLIDRVRYAPIKGGYKVYIIDEVHMLTTEAFNALLKTLEEPPSNVVFILATTEPFKLMPTILSRCQRYDFMKVGDQDLLVRLKDICDKENILADDKALSLLVSLADGGVRDALSMLDQAIAYSGAHLEEHHINEIFGLSSSEEKISLLNAIKEGDIVKLTILSDTFIQKGYDVRRLTQDLLNILKDLLISKNSTDYSLLKVLNIEDLNKINTFTIKEINEMVDVLLNAVTQYRFVASANSLFEITLLKLSSLTSNMETKEDINVFKPRVEIKKDIEFNQAQSRLASFASATKSDEIPDFSENGAIIDFNDEDILNVMVQANKSEKQIILDAWNNLSSVANDGKLEKYYYTLKQCFPRIVAKEAIVLEAPFNNICTRTNIVLNQKGFRELIRRVTDRDYLVICLTHNQYLDMVKRFTDLNQVKKLPNPTPINLNIKGKED